MKDTGEEVSLHDHQEDVEVMACAITLLHKHYIAIEVKDIGEEISLHDQQEEVKVMAWDVL